jgi:hypothetical protein
VCSSADRIAAAIAAWSFLVIGTTSSLTLPLPQKSRRPLRIRGRKSRRPSWTRTNRRAPGGKLHAARRACRRSPSCRRRRTGSARPRSRPPPPRRASKKWLSRNTTSYGRRFSTSAVAADVDEHDRHETLDAAPSGPRPRGSLAVIILSGAGGNLDAMSKYVECALGVTEGTDQAGRPVALKDLVKNIFNDGRPPLGVSPRRSFGLPLIVLPIAFAPT